MLVRKVAKHISSITSNTQNISPAAYKHCPNEKCMSIKAYPRNGIVLNSTFTKKVIKGLPKNWDSN